MVIRVRDLNGLPMRRTSTLDRIMFGGGSAKQSRFKRITAQSKKLKNRIVQNILSKFMTRKKGGTLYGTKHQRGQKKKKRKQRGGFIPLFFPSDGITKKHSEDLRGMLNNFAIAATNAVNTVKKQG